MVIETILEGQRATPDRLQRLHDHLRAFGVVDVGVRLLRDLGEGDGEVAPIVQVQDDDLRGVALTVRAGLGLDLPQQILDQHMRDFLALDADETPGSSDPDSR